MEEIPVPIPNTEVKLQCAENTCGLPCWEDKLLPVLLFYLSLDVSSFEKYDSKLFPTCNGCILTCGKYVSLDIE